MKPIACRNGLLCLLVAATGLLPMLAQAALPRCGDLSPAKKNGVNLFTEELAEDLIPSEREDLLKLFRKLRGQWRGRYKKTICLLGSEGPYPQVKEGGVVVGAQWEKHRQALTMEWRILESGKSAREGGHLYFFIEGKRLHIGQDIHRRDVIVLEAGKQRVKTYWRYLRARPPGQAPLAVEEGTALSLDGRRLTVRRVFFVNGELAGIETWKLHR